MDGDYTVLPHSPFYYHTLIDEIPNLIRLRDVYPQCNNIITHELTPSWALELLRHFNFRICILSEKAVIVENLFAVSAPSAIVRKNLEYLRREITMEPDKIVVVSRKGAPRSDNDIEQEILSRVSGSILIDPSNFSVEGQIEIFSNARIIIGLHGGALTNCIWMDTSGKVIEIFNHAYRTSDYERLCAELRISYIGVETENLSSEEVGSVVARLISDTKE
jgi:capsular polysaccharide biosynthesis protein